MKTLALLALTVLLLGCLQQPAVGKNSSQVACGAGVSCAGNQSIASEPAYSLAFSAIDLDGNPITQTQFEGKVVILQGFASWCSSCAAGAETIKQVYSKFADKGLQVIYFDVMPSGEPADQVRAFRSQYGDVRWHWIAEANVLPAKLGVSSLEYTAVLDGGGNIVYQNNGASSPNELSEAVMKAFGRSS